MSTLERAFSIAACAHTGMTNKVGAPYILHPIRVMLKVDSPEARIVAVLHDVVNNFARVGLLHPIRVLGIMRCLDLSQGILFL
jgi:(p)ppGpp synthase/HD superfamily hydrolase